MKKGDKYSYKNENEVSLIQLEDFHNLIKDWNNDGDVYEMNVALFEDINNDIRDYYTKEDIEDCYKLIK